MTRDLRVNTATAALFVAAVVFQHFQIGLPAGYPLTVGAMLAPLLVVALTRRFDLRLAGIVIGTIITLTCLAAIFDPLHATVFKYVKSTGLCVVTVAFLLAALDGLEPRWPGRWRLVDVVLGTLGIVTAMCTAQAVTSFVGIDVLFNPWGPYQYLYPYELWLSPGTFYRTEAFYLEPSYAALTITFLLAAALCLGGRDRWAIGLGVLGVMCTQSATGLGVTLLMLLLWGLASKTGRLLSIVMSGVMMFAAGGYLLSRLGSASESNSSAYYRLVAPLGLISDVLTKVPLGRPMGSVEQVVAEAALVNGTDAGSTIDNGYFLVMYYFGWAGVVFCFVMMGYLLWAMYRAERRQDGSGPAIGWLFACWYFNGGIFLPEFAMMMWFVLAAVRSTAIDNQMENPCEHNADPVDPDRDLPRPARSSSDARLTV